MNYSNGDDELERMRDRNRRGARHGAGRSASPAGRQTPSRRQAESGSGTQGGYDGGDYFDREYSQEEYGPGDYDYQEDGYNGYRQEDDYEEDDYEENGYEEDDCEEYEREEAGDRKCRLDRRAYGRDQAASARPARKASGRSASPRKKKSSRNASGPSGSWQQDGRMAQNLSGRNKDAARRPGQGKGQMVKQRKKKRLRLKGILLILLAAVIGYGAWLFLHKPTGIWNVAVFGVDSRDGNTKNALSDVLMICSFDRSTGDIKLVSVYRDSYLKINSKGTYHKINEAYFKGGHKQAVDALEENLDIKIDDYATFNWKSVAEAINILGGVDIDITPAEFKYINGFITETVNSTGIGSVQLKKSGPNHLDGVQAVAYSRLRLMDTDFQRTERQRTVIKLALEKAKKANVSTLTSLVTYLIPQISTSIGADDVLPMVKDIGKYHIGETAGFPFSRQTMRIGRMDCVVPTTLESNVIQLHQFLYGENAGYAPSSAVKKISAHISEETGLYEEGKTAPLGGGSNGSSPAQEKTPPQTAPAAKEPEPDFGETDPTEESSQEPTEDMTEPETEPVTENESEPEETGEIGPGIPAKPAVKPDSVKEETEETNPGPGGFSNPPSGGPDSPSAKPGPFTQSPGTSGANTGGSGLSGGASDSGHSGPGEVGPGV